MHQTGHLNQTFKRAFQLIKTIQRQPALHLQGLQDLFGDVTPGLLHLQRMRQAGTNGSVTLQRKHLRFLLQTPDSGGVYNPSAIALKMACNVIFAFRFLAAVIRAREADLLPEIDR